MVSGKAYDAPQPEAYWMCSEDCGASHNAARDHFPRHAHAAITEQDRASTKPVDIQRCLKAGVLPNCYENTIIDIEVQEQLRLCLSEHPFGTVKWYHGAYYLLCRGIEKATGELGLSFLAYNLKRAINMVGTKKLVAAMKA